MKKVWLIISGGLVLGLLGAGGYLLYSRTQSAAVTPAGTEAAATPTPVPKLLNWDDPAGFSVQYPDGLAVNKHDEDSVNYAHVEFTSPGKPGSIVIWVKDIPKGVTDTKSWVKKDASLSAGTTFDTLLGGQPAQKILLTTSPKKEVIGAVYDDALFYIETTLDDGGYWKATADTLSGSFTYKPINSQDAAAPAAGGGDTQTSVDEEETLQ